jgi:hypothetical protein
MLYLKLNSFHADPLGEDARTLEFRRHTEAQLRLTDTELEEAIPILGRRVDYVHRRFSRDWREVIGVVLYGEKHFTLDEAELQALRLMDGQRSICAIVKAVGEKYAGIQNYEWVRRLASRGVIDLLPGLKVNSPATSAVSVFPERNLPSLAF